MKFQLKGDSICVRLYRRDIERLIDEGRVVETVRLGAGLALSYAVEAAAAPSAQPKVSNAAGPITVRIDPADLADWHSGDRVGYDHHQLVDGGAVRVVLEKDFARIDWPHGEEADDAYAFPNPSLFC